MARYQERFPGKSQAFLIRSAAGSDAEKLIAYMVQVNQETTFLSMEPGEFEASYPVEKEASYLDSIAQSQDRQLLIAVTPNGEIAETAAVNTQGIGGACGTLLCWTSP